MAPLLMSQIQKREEVKDLILIRLLSYNHDNNASYSLNVYTCYKMFFIFLKGDWGCGV